jgi:hypothetical protein
MKKCITAALLTEVIFNSWRRIKKDFLHHFHSPRLDLLVWILMVKLAPAYYRKLDLALVDIGRYCELPAWQKDFKHAWIKANKSPITLPLNERYCPDPVRWVCTCPQFVVDHFLICKHLVQAVHPVHPVFFLEVKRNRTLPFWSHPSLIPLSDNHTQASASIPATTVESLDSTQPTSPENDYDGDHGVDGSDDELSELIDMRQDGRATYRETMKTHVDAIRDFCDGLEYQIQFEDQRFLDTLEREGAHFLRLMENCLSRERCSNSTRPGSIAPAMWEQSTANAMFYRTRPVASERHT